MSGVIFLMRDDGTLAELREAPYDSERILQELIAEYPELLAGDQVNPASPRKWLVITREAGVPSKEGGGAQWSADHLLLDQDGVPTIVEVKRSSDTRIRREVVGQMLDYAANAIVYWPLERIKTMHEKWCASRFKRPEEEILKFLLPRVLKKKRAP